MDNKTKAEVRIFGNDYTLVGTDSEEYITKIAYTVDKKMREISQNPILKPIKISVLTAVNFCDEYFKASARLDEAREDVEKYKEEISALKEEIRTLNEEKNFLKSEIQNTRKNRYNG